MNICKCGKQFQTKLAPCPDSYALCCVAHFDATSFVCPECGYDLGPDFVSAFKEGRVTEEEGISIINTAAIAKLELI